MTVYASTFVKILLSQRGDPYIFGYEVNLNDPNPRAFDCSEFIEWAAHRAGGYMPDGSPAQWDYCRRKGTSIGVAAAVRTSGALLHKDGHIAISLGNGNTIEAKGKAYGVGVFSAAGRGWTHGMKVPGMVYGAPPKPPATTAPRWPGRFLTQPPMMKMLVAEKPYQQRLAALGLYGGPIDLLYGPSMESATRALQDRKGIRVDGVAGEDSWYAAWR